MANNPYVNKFVYHGQTKFDLSADTIEPSDLKDGVTAHDKSGAPIVGTNTFDSDTSEDTAAVAEILTGKTAHARGTLLTGTMPNRGAVTGYISDTDDEYTIQQGYHDGSGKVALDATEKSKIIPGNIKAGVEMLGVTGTYSGEAISVQSKIATPSNVQQVITPDSGYDYLAQVTVNAIPYTETDNAAGGITITIG